MDVLTERSAVVERSSTALDRIESLYLSSLRAILLFAATMLLLAALVWSAISLIKVLKSPESVETKPSAVASGELLKANIIASDSLGGSVPSNSLREQRSFYDQFVKKHFSLYQKKYLPNLRSEDKQLSISEFDDLTINSAARLDAVRNGELDFSVDKKELDTFFPIISEASSSQPTTDRLTKYRLATKKPTATQVQRFRTENRRGWDTYSQNCNAWYTSPIGCPVTRAVSVPYSEKVVVMRYPENIASPSEILKAYQGRYFALLNERRQSNAREAGSERQDIIDGQVEGWRGLSRSVMIVGAFLILMFFFLLVAIERHQRRISAALP